jgi:hypothetical protein
MSFTRIALETHITHMSTGVKFYWLVNLFVRCDDPSSHFSTVAMKIENRLSTLTNKIKENLSLLGDGCSLLTLVNNENYY